jgi:hypothetical protein
MKLTGENRSTRGKTCPSVNFSTTNPTWTDPGSNLGLRGQPPEPWHVPNTPLRGPYPNYYNVCAVPVCKLTPFSCWNL